MQKNAAFPAQEGKLGADFQFAMSVISIHNLCFFHHLLLFVKYSS